MIFKMLDDKSLIMTRCTTIYQGEQNTDSILFLLPQTQDSVDLTECSAHIHYRRANGDFHMVSLQKDPLLLQDYLQFLLPISIELTATEGEIAFFLSLEDKDDRRLMKTGTAHLTIIPREDFDIEYPGDEPTPEMIEMIDRVSVLEKTHVDNLEYDQENETMQLSAGGMGIGDVVDLSNMINQDDVIHFDGGDSDEDTGDSGDEPTDDNDDVIHF